MQVTRLSNIRHLSMDKYRFTILLGSGNEARVDRFVPLDVLKYHQEALKGGMARAYFEGCDRIGQALANS